MPESYVIDGYNLIHALGMIQKNMDAGGLEESRRWLLTYLADGFGDDAPRVTVVFDAQHAPPGLPKQQTCHGLHIHFAPKNQSADDWIEMLIEQEPQFRSLAVVSNDMRLQTAARRRGALAWSHEALLDFLEKRTKTTLPPTEDLDRGVSPEEKERWLKEFGPIEKDPSLKEFFDLDRFE